MKFFIGIFLTMTELELATSTRAWLKRLRRYAGTLLYKEMPTGVFKVQHWDGDSWNLIDQPIDTGPFGQAIALVSHQLTLFQERSFPADLVSRKDLAEAIELDIQQWSPWGAETSYFYLPKKQGDTWVVALWVWEKGVVGQYLAGLQADKWPVTHVIPEDVWLSTGITGVDYPVVAIHPGADGAIYHYLPMHAHISQVTQINNERQAQHFWRSLGAKADAIKSLVIDKSLEQKQIPWCPAIELVTVPLRLPPFGVLEHGRLPGVKDWRHPASWSKVFYSAGALILLWMLGSAFVLWAKGIEVSSALESASSGAGMVIDARDRVDELGAKLRTIDQLQLQQQLPLHFLSELATTLPDDVWLQTMSFRQDAVEIRGQGKNAASLAGLLEKISIVKRVNYIGDIRPDGQTGQEVFAIRLQLDSGLQVVDE